MRIPEILQPTHVKSYLIKLYNSPINTLLSQKKMEDKKRRNYDRKYLILFKPPNLIEDHPVVLSFFFLVSFPIIFKSLFHCTFPTICTDIGSAIHLSSVLLSKLLKPVFSFLFLFFTLLFRCQSNRNCWRQNHKAWEIIRFRAGW